MAAALLQFFGAARHPCFEVSAWLSTFSRDAMRIMCFSLAGRWWRAEWETGLFKAELVYVHIFWPGDQEIFSG